MFRKQDAVSLADRPLDLVEIMDGMGDSWQGERQAVEAAIDAGPSALAQIAKALHVYAGSKRRIALRTLAYLGGDGAIEVLRHECGDRPDPDASAALCAALASRGNAADRAYLVEVIEAGCIGDNWYRIESAALSTGVLRAVEALPAWRM